MKKYSWEKVETIVDQALEMPKGEQKAFIEEACAENAGLKNEVTNLLESIFNSKGWLDQPKDFKKEFYGEIADDINELSPHHSLIGERFGAYTIQEKIGLGGMGSVYLAGRTEDHFKHRVAIKIISESQATKQNIRRFEQEQRILAGLHHPGIAQLYNGGVTEGGIPYITMEYVDGLPIDEYCREQNTSINDKIKLFKKVLEAVRYAHENLVIHRDLKPGNILVDNNGRAKILDFGISKLKDAEEDPQLTQTGARLLTPRYAAPEQIKEQNITTATDMYALGIIFYQLMADEYPYNLDDLSQFEIEQLILEASPSKPSTKLSSASKKTNCR